MRAGQPVKIGNCGGKYPKVTGRWVLQWVKVTPEGEPSEVTVHGGPRGREMMRTFPAERLKAPGAK